MHAINRRSFFRSLGLGAGATLLGPIYDTLVREAWGAPLERKVAVFLLNGQGNTPVNMFPPEARKQQQFSYAACGSGSFGPGELLPDTFSWPEAWKGLERWRHKTLFLDGLGLRIRQSQHTAGYSALTGLDTLGNPPEHGGAPAGPSIDQFLAERIGRDTPIKSVLFGASSGSNPMHANVFASGPNKPEPFFKSPSMMFARVFGSVPVAAGDGKPGVDKRRLLMDVVRNDIKKLQTNLAGPERLKLDHYLAAIGDLETRVKASPTMSCRTPARPGDTGTAEDRLEIMTDMATLAVLCGLTNVVGISAACGHGHGGCTTFGRTLPGGWPGHSPPEVVVAAGLKLYPFYASLMARMIEGMSGVKVGGKTLFDNSAMLFTNDNGTDHHDSHKSRWPMILVGDAGGALAKVDGRYRRFGDVTCNQHNPNNSKEPTLPDFYGTLASAFGAPGTFAEGALIPLKGPIRELLASG